MNELYTQLGILENIIPITQNSVKASTKETRSKGINLRFYQMKKIQQKIKIQVISSEPDSDIKESHASPLLLSSFVQIKLFIC